MKKRIWSIVFAVISVMILCMLPERKTMAVDPAVKICGINLPKNNYMDINHHVGTDCQNHFHCTCLTIGCAAPTINCKGVDEDSSLPYMQQRAANGEKRCMIGR